MLNDLELFHTWPWRFDLELVTLNMWLVEIISYWMIMNCFMNDLELFHTWPWRFDLELVTLNMWLVEIISYWLIMNCFMNDLELFHDWPWRYDLYTFRSWRFSRRGGRTDTSWSGSAIPCTHATGTTSQLSSLNDFSKFI